MGPRDTEEAAAGTADTAAAMGGGDARIGAVVDKYTIVRLLGRGGMGAVYEARHAKLARRFAIKFLLPQLAADPQVLRRFENEAKAAGGLEHPNLAAVTDAGRTADGAPYLVMEYLPGEDCAKLLRRIGPLPVPRAANIVLQACRGLHVAHRAGIVHRDLKPENLFVTDAGDGSDQVKVLDFGIAKLQQSDASVATGTGATFGTAYYMSPEQARGAGEVDHRADVWSLGVVLYELLSGQRPFEGEQFLNVVYQILSAEPPPLSTRREGLPASIVAVVERAMTKEIGQRCPSVAAFGEALAPFAGKASAVLPVIDGASGPTPTRATPATEAREVSLGTAGPMLENRPGLRPLQSAPASRSKRPALVAGALALALALAAAIWLARGGVQRSTSASAPPPAIAPPEETTRPGGAPSAAGPASPPASAAIPALPPAPPSAGDEVPPASTPPARVRTVFEQSEHGSAKRGSSSTAPRRLIVSPPPSVAPLRPAPSAAATIPAPPLGAPALPVAAPPPVGHPITIEKDNPYGP